MITVSINGQSKQIKGHLEEITIDEFERLCRVILEEREDIIDKHLDIFSVLGMSEDDLNMITPDEFVETLKQFRSLDKDVKDFQKEITIDGKVYSAYTGDKFILSVRDLARIEKFIKIGKHKFVGELLAVIYKDNTLSKEANYNPDYIAEKAKLFREKMTADVAYPYLNLITKDLTNTILNGLKDS